MLYIVFVSAYDKSYKYNTFKQIVSYVMHKTMNRLWMDYDLCWFLKNVGQLRNPDKHRLLGMNQYL